MSVVKAEDKIYVTMSQQEAVTLKNKLEWAGVNIENSFYSDFLVSLSGCGANVEMIMSEEDAKLLMKELEVAAIWDKVGSIYYDLFFLEM